MAKKIRGTAEEAHNWINDSLLSEEQKKALLNFVKDFPTLTYFKKERPERNRSCVA